MRVGRHGLLEQAIEEQPAVAGAAAVEAGGELVEVVVELVVGDAALVVPSSQRLSRLATRWTSGIATWAGSPEAETFVATWVKRCSPTPL